MATVHTFSSATFGTLTLTAAMFVGIVLYLTMTLGYVMKARMLIPALE